MTKYIYSGSKEGLTKAEEGVNQASDDDSIYTPTGAFKNNLLSDEGKSFCAAEPKGSVTYRGTIPPGIMIIENFLDREKCEFFLNYANKTQGKKLNVIDEKKTTKDTVASKQTDQRITEFVPLGSIESEIISLFKDVFQNQVSDFYKIDLEWFEKPQLIRYREGGKYDAHSDSEHWDAEKREWVRDLDRSHSAILYLNEKFEGGGIYFPNFDFRLQPKRGMLVIFLSDHRYLHAAEPLTSGIRYAIVTWAAACGIKRIRTKVASGSISLK